MNQAVTDYIQKISQAWQTLICTQLLAQASATL
jgi:hypothetical protein